MSGPLSGVKIVEFASYGAMWKGLLNNDADGAFGSTVTGPAKEVETSPRGLVWPELPPEDKAAWERVRKVGAQARVSTPTPETPERASKVADSITRRLGEIFIQ